MTPELIERLAEHIGLGMTQEQACWVENCNPKTMNSALRRNPEFAEAVKKAQSIRIQLGLTGIWAGDKGWQGKAWVLERCHHGQFPRQFAGSLAVTSVDAISPEVRAQIASVAKMEFTGPHGRSHANGAAGHPKEETRAEGRAHAAGANGNGSG